MHILLFDSPEQKHTWNAPAVAVVALNCRGIKLGVVCWGGGGPAWGWGLRKWGLMGIFRGWTSTRWGWSCGWICGWVCGCGGGWWTIAGGCMGSCKGTNKGYAQLSHFTVNTLRQDKMANIWQTTFSNIFLTVKMFEFRFRWSLFLGDQLTISEHWFR